MIRGRDYSEATDRLSLVFIGYPRDDHSATTKDKRSGRAGNGGCSVAGVTFSVTEARHWTTKRIEGSDWRRRTPRQRRGSSNTLPVMCGLVEPPQNAAAHGHGGKRLPSSTVDAASTNRRHARKCMNIYFGESMPTARNSAHLKSWPYPQNLRPRTRSPEHHEARGCHTYPRYVGAPPPKKLRQRAVVPTLTLIISMGHRAMSAKNSAEADPTR